MLRPRSMPVMPRRPPWQAPHSIMRCVRAHWAALARHWATQARHLGRHRRARAPSFRVCVFVCARARVPIRLLVGCGRAARRVLEERQRTQRASWLTAPRAAQRRTMSAVLPSVRPATARLRAGAWDAEAESDFAGFQADHAASCALFRPLPHLRRDWAHAATSAPGPGSPPPTSAPGLGSPLPTSAP